MRRVSPSVRTVRLSQSQLNLWIVMGIVGFIDGYWQDTNQPGIECYFMPVPDDQYNNQALVEQMRNILDQKTKLKTNTGD